MSNIISVRYKLSSLIDEVSEIVTSHANIRLDDEDYEDPEEWWACPLLESLVTARDELEDTL